MIANGYGGSFQGDENVLKWKCDGCTTLDILKIMEWCILNGSIVWYVNYSSLKLLYKITATSFSCQTHEIGILGMALTFCDKPSGDCCV